MLKVMVKQVPNISSNKNSTFMYKSSEMFEQKIVLSSHILEQL